MGIGARGESGSLLVRRECRLDPSATRLPLFALVLVSPMIFFFSSRRRHTRSLRDWSSDVCSSDLKQKTAYRSLRDWSSDVCSSDLSTRLNSSHVEISYAVFCLTGVQTCA